VGLSEGSEASTDCRQSSMRLGVCTHFGSFERRAATRRSLVTRPLNGLFDLAIRALSWQFFSFFLLMVNQSQNTRSGATYSSSSDIIVSSMAVAIGAGALRCSSEVDMYTFMLGGSNY